MELFLDTTPKSTFLSFLSQLTNLSSTKITPIQLSNSSLKLLQDPESKFKLPSLPCLITADGNILTSVFSISSYLTQISFTEKILFDKPQEIISVIEFLERKSLNEIIEYFNEMLEMKSFLVGQHLTLADLALFSYIQSTLVLYTDEKKWEISNLYRWFLHIQAMPNIKNYLQRNSIPLALKPRPILVQEKSKSLLKKEAKKSQKQQQSAATNGNAAPKPKQQQQQKGQQQNNKKNVQSTRPKIPGEIKPEDFYIFDMRIGKLTSVWKHESSAKLYCEKISTGSKQYNVASGLQHHIPEDQMKGQIILLTNLKERKLAGFTSEGMVMCASIKGETEEKIELLRVQANDQGEKDVGGRIVLEGVDEKEGFEGVTDKDGVVGKLLAGMKVDDEGFATFMGKRWIVNGNFVKAQTLKNCIIS